MAVTHFKSRYLVFCVVIKSTFNPYPVKLIYLNFHPLEVVSRYHDPQLEWLKITDICLI